ncbi:UDP-2,4-diacetamido-2,4,6-trideoxy-beta-L-altropyranose hydrolase [Alkalibacillus haloalkaliphilus]|uniref:UDP-2,4-diacetamido-2,4, 6-trideoxy-beta-L-altropyranose hydrolase n=1 Tax=Alkalibacillus haloalkaliphilus TaxID=94136 RepID=UPI00293677B9|nr:UDP-2,4-diacetamido-2,4,6-trideoxy-beta-L-altropyranose hydrolase [Alkalibacillus haloalkaliphilus]MDV2583340.1 UDP-2,4-diacetamido-2,4,6-trideoxy-beta-L-altropyranose hydrolase [Alkalibacillus haloalkaliphilus]
MEQKNIYIRVDASRDMGSGHVIRCLTLADELRKTGHQVEFICRQLNGDLINMIQDKGFYVHTLTKTNTTDLPLVTQHSHWLQVSWEQDAEEVKSIVKHKRVDWLIIDHYAIDVNWEKVLRPYVKRIMIIDDLADREHDGDLLLDQNYYTDQDTRYLQLVPESCQTLLGPSYALLRDEFRMSPPYIREKLSRILVFMGGSDPTNETRKVIEGFLQLNPQSIKLDVVIGKLNLYTETLQKLCEPYSNIRCFTHIDYISELMLNADLAFGAAGSTTWERCSLGLPSAVMTVARNQESLIQHIASTGSILNLGRASENSSKQIASVIESFLKKPELLTDMSRHCLELVDVNGVKKVVEKMNQLDQSSKERG